MLPGKSFSMDTVMHTRRRVAVFLKHMQLWYDQAPEPARLPPGMITMVTSTVAHRRAFYSQLCPVEKCTAERLQLYGAHTLAIERTTDHAELYFKVITNQDAEIVQLLCDTLRGV